MRAAAAFYAKEAGEGKPAPEYYTFTAKSLLTTEETQETIQFLEDLSDHVHFTESDTIENYAITWTCKLSPSSKGYDPDKKLYTGRDGQLTTKATVLVYLHSKVIVWCRAWRDPKSMMTTPQVQQTTFVLAVTICHEMIHAAWLCLVDSILGHDGHQEPFFQDEPFAGLGNAREKYALGGTVRYIGCDRGLVIYQWPQNRDTEEYAASNVRGLRRPSSWQWFADPKQISRFFYAPFWKALVESHARKTKVLKLRKIQGKDEEVTAVQRMYEEDELYKMPMPPITMTTESFESMRRYCKLQRGAAAKENAVEASTPIKREESEESGNFDVMDTSE